eukprot:12008600-Heterocapsa_arctica.AAC.1
MLTVEIAKDRLAMLAIIGSFFWEGLAGSAWGEWALYTASPLQAFEVHGLLRDLAGPAPGHCCDER